MGNNKSVLKKKKHEIQNESDSDGEEVEVILEIEEQAGEDVESLTSRDCEKCKHLYGSELIPVKDLSLSSLPESLRYEQVLDYILMQERKAVKLQVKKTGASAGLIDTASGWACVSEEAVVEYSECPIKDCPLSKHKSHKAYGGITVFTNKHVVSNKDEGVNCKIIFFYDDRNKTTTGGQVFLPQEPSGVGGLMSPGLSRSNVLSSDLDMCAWGLCVKQDQANKDLVAIETICHDPRLFTVIATSSAQCLNSWSEMPDNLKKELTEQVIVISHPHGRPKVVSVGKLICLETEAVEHGIDRETCYRAATCRGSSGAPVISGHYPHRPFTHSSKRLWKGGCENFSRSY